MRVLLPAQFVQSLGYGVLFSLMAELQDAHGFATAGLGLISGATFVTSLVAQLTMSRYADRGHARTLLAAGLAAQIAALVWIGLAADLWQFVTARAVEGFGIGCFLPAARALVVTSDPDRSGRNLGMLSAVDLGGVTIGPVVGAVLAALFGLAAPFFVLAVLTAGALVFVAVVAGREHEAPIEAGGRNSLRRLIRIRRVIGVAIITLALEFPMGVYDSLWARYLTDRGASQLFVGVSLFVFGLPFMAFATLGGRLADRYGPLRVAVLGGLVIIPTTLAYGLIAAPIGILLVSIVESIGASAAFPGAQAAMAEASPPDLVASGQGLALAAGIGGAGVAAMVAAPIYQDLGSGWLFAGTAAVMAILVAIGAGVARSGEGMRRSAADTADAASSPPLGSPG